MKILDKLKNELGIRHQAWVIVSNVLQFTDDFGERKLPVLLSKHLFFFSLNDSEGRTLVIDDKLQELILNNEELQEISDLVYFEMPLVDFELEVPGSNPPIFLPCASSRLIAWSTIPEDIVNVAHFIRKYPLELFYRARY